MLKLSPAVAVSLGPSLPVAVTVSGSGSLQHMLTTINPAGAEQSSGVPVATLVAGPNPGPVAVTVSSPGEAFQPVTATATVNPTGTITVAPIASRQAGADVPVTATLGGAPTGTTVSFTSTAPDGETGLLATHSMVNSAQATTNRDGVATVVLPDQYMSGTYQLNVSAPGYAPMHTTYVVQPGPAVKMAAVIAPSPFIDAGKSARLSVAAVDQYGNPVPGVTVPVQAHLQGAGATYTPTTAAVYGQGDAGTVTAGYRQVDATLVVRTLAFGGQTQRLPVRVITNPLQLIQGKGTWVPYWVWAQLGTQKMIDQMKAQGMTHLYLETAASCCGFYGRLPLDRVVDAAHDAGIAVITWNYDALSNVAQDEASAQAALAYRTRLGSGTDGFTADLEANLNAGAVGSFSAYIRQLLGPQGLYVATIYPPQDAWANTPMKTLAAYVSAFAPMAYWHGQARDYTYQSVYNYIATSVQDIEQAVPGAAVEVIAEAYDMYAYSGTGSYSPTPLEEEAALLAASDNRATGISFYDLGTESAGESQMTRNPALSVYRPRPTGNARGGPSSVR